MTCDTIQSQLTAFLDGEIPTETLAEFEAHLQACAACGEARHAQAMLSETLSSWAVHAPDITSSVMQAVITDNQTLLLTEMRELRAEMRELRAEIRQLREEVVAQRHPSPSRPPAWFPAPNPNYARMEENDPWNFVRS